MTTGRTALLRIKFEMSVDQFSGKKKFHCASSYRCDASLKYLLAESASPPPPPSRPDNVFIYLGGFSKKYSPKLYKKVSFCHKKV